MIQPDRIIRSNRKTLSISIDRLGALIVRTPRNYSLERIFSFIEQKEDWIRKAQAKAKENARFLPPKNLDGYTFLLCGNKVEIVLYDRGRVAFNEQTGALFVPREFAMERLQAWLKRYAKKRLSQMVYTRAQEMSLTVESVLITSAKTRWGSCSGKGKLHFSYHLIYASESVMDYVVIHELAHIPFKNHGKQFWGMVAKYCPDYTQKRKWLKENAFLMDIF